MAVRICFNKLVECIFINQSALILSQKNCSLQDDDKQLCEGTPTRYGSSFSDHKSLKDSFNLIHAKMGFSIIMKYKRKAIGELLTCKP